MGNCLGSSSFCNTRRDSQDDQASRSCSRGVVASTTAVATIAAAVGPNDSQCGSVVDASGGVVTLSAQSLNNHLASLDVVDVNNNPEVNLSSSGRNSTRSNRIVARSNSVSITPAPNTNPNNNYQFFSLNNPYSYYVPPTGKTKKLKKDYGKYLKCEKRWGEAQLKAKRDEFWDTAPAFEGKPEIWSALQAAVESLDAKNFELAQAIIDSANIIVPSGLLTDCYDELGNRYQIPVYVLVKPNHLIKKARDAQKKKNQKKKGKKSDRNKSSEQQQQPTGDNNNNEDDDENNSEMDDEMTSDRLDDDDYFYDDYYDHDYDESSHHNSYSQAKKNKKNKKSKTGESPVETAEEEAVMIKCRVSTLNEEVNSDLKVSVMPSQTVLSLKQQLQNMTNIQVSQQRLFFGGKMMRDKDRLRLHRLKKNVVIQVIVRPSKEATPPTVGAVVTTDPQPVVDDDAATAATISPAVETITETNNLSPIVVN